MPTADEEIVVDASPDLVNPNFINLTDSLPADQRYSFIFEGTPQALDHHIINTVANSFLQRYHIARNNADFPEGPLFAERCDETGAQFRSRHAGLLLQVPGSSDHHNRRGCVGGVQCG